MIYFILLSFLFIALNVLDWYSTKRILDKGGRELNPVIRAVGIIPVKAVITVLILLSGYFVHWAVLIPANILMVGVCVWNFIQLGKIK